jgi:hypothetical protein
MTPTADEKPPGNVMPETHVGVIAYRGSLSPMQQDFLRRILTRIGDGNDGPFTLHHGCNPGADEVAHRIVREFCGWRIHGHPSSGTDGGSPGHSEGMMRDLDVAHESKPRSECNVDIVKASDIVIALPRYAEYDRRSSQSEIWRAIRIARAADRDIVFLPRPVLVSRKTALKRGTATVAAADDLKWYARRGRIDRTAGTACRKYQRFLSVYSLSDSESTRQKWTAYRQATKEPRKIAHACPRCRKPVGNSRERWGWICEDCADPGSKWAGSRRRRWMGPD